MDTVTTSPSADSLIDLDDPLGLLGSEPQEREVTKEEFIVMGYRLHGDNRPEEVILAEHEQARLRSVAVFSSSPLYQARAAKDPEYWNKFSVGGVR